MLRKTLVSMAVFAIIILSTAVYAFAQTDATTPPQGNYASVNGLEMYYEIHGTGEPLILLHGGLGGIAEFGALLPLLSESHQVIAVELQVHGHTADIDRPLSYEAMADDVAALIVELGYESADVMGYSLGGGVALRTAIQHSEVVRKLILISTPYKREGIHLEFRSGMEAMTAETAEMMLETPMYQFYAGVAPKLENWSTLVGKVGEMMANDYDWSAEVETMTTPTLIVQGDSDMLSPQQGVELFGLRGGGVAGGFAPIPDSQLAVLPNTIHFDILYRTDLLIPIINGFLNPPAPPAQ